MHISLTMLIVFLLVSTSVMGLGHLYVWRRLVRDAELPTGWNRALSVLLLLLMASQPAIMILSRGLPRDVISPWAWIAFGWMGMLSTFFSLLLLVDLIRWMLAGAKRLRRQRSEDDAPQTPERRAALRRLVAGGVALGGVGLGSAGMVAAAQFTLKNVGISLSKLPREFNGFRILQLSDIHVGPTIGRSFVEAMVAVANAQKADLIAITGDLVDGSVEALREHTSPLAQLEAPHGVFFVTGNHEYYSGVDDWVGEVERLGITVLRNDGRRVTRDGASFFLAGVTDHHAGRHGDAPNFPMALRDRNPEEELVLLAHQPAALTEAKQLDTGLILSGHTHGGQLWPWNWLVHLAQPVVAGLARFGRTQVYVNTGTGYWGPPMRLGTQSEITVVTLRAKA